MEVENQGFWPMPNNPVDPFLAILAGLAHKYDVILPCLLVDGFCRREIIIDDAPLCVDLCGGFMHCSQELHRVVDRVKPAAVSALKK